MNRTPTYWFKVGLFILGTMLLAAFVLLTKNVKDIGDGWKWLLEFIAGLFANVVAAFIYLFWFERDAERRKGELERDANQRMEVLIEKLKQPGGRVIQQRGDVTRIEYEQYFDSSREIEALGIACKSVMRGLFPGYESADAQFNIRKCQDSVLYRRLKKGDDPFEAKIFFLNPNGKYASARNGEAGNKDTITDLNAIVAALKNICEGFSQQRAKSTDELWKLSGNLSFFMFDEHPINSVFCAKRKEDDDVVFVGYLFSGVSGESCPTVEFIKENQVRQQCQKHLAAIEQRSELLFRWNHGGPQFYPDALTQKHKPESHS